MRSFFYILTVLAVIGLAFWAYRENYKTQATLAQTAQLNREIGVLRARMARLNAEWAYLNRPDRLNDLAKLNFERLQLMPLTADQFGRVDQIAFPPLPSRIIIENPIEVTGFTVSQRLEARP